MRGTSAFPQQPTVGELFQQLSVSDQEELLFIQLPDTIPGQPKTSSPEKTKKDNKTEDKRSSQIKSLVSLFHTMPLEGVMSGFFFCFFFIKLLFFATVYYTSCFHRSVSVYTIFQSWGKLLLKVMRYNIALLPKKKHTAHA